MSFLRRRPSADPLPHQAPAPARPAGPAPLPLPGQGSAPAYPPPPVYVATTRVSPNVVDFPLRPRNKATLPPPSVELEGTISASEWFSRVEKLRALLMRYEWSVLERVGVVVGLVALVAVPAVLSSTVGRGLVHSAQEANPITVDDNNNSVVDVPAPVRRAVIEARAITIATFLVLLALITVPYVVFKRTGHKKLGLLLQSFNQQPTGPSRDPASRLAWQLKSVSLYGQSAILQVTLPLSASPTVFHPNAYLPEYMVKLDDDPNARGGAGAVAADGNEDEWEDVKR